MDSIIKHNKVSGLSDSKNSRKMEKIIKKHRVSICEHSVKLSDLIDHVDLDPPIVNLKKNGDVLESIEIICPCGRKIEVLCEYD